MNQAQKTMTANRKSFLNEAKALRRRALAEDDATSREAIMAQMENAKRKAQRISGWLADTKFKEEVK